MMTKVFQRLDATLDLEVGFAVKVLCFNIAQALLLVRRGEHSDISWDGFVLLQPNNVTHDDIGPRHVEPIAIAQHTAVLAVELPIGPEADDVFKGVLVCRTDD